jgi:hypothetical protein
VVPNSFTFAPVADAYVAESKPTTNFGGTTLLRVDSSPLARSYLRFNVQGLVSPVTRATLRIYSNNTSSAGYEVRALADNSWDEKTISFANAPLPSATVAGQSGRLTGGTWSSVDVTQLIADNGSVSLVLTTTSSAQLNFGSRESGATAPQLVIVTAN